MQQSRKQTLSLWMTETLSSFAAQLSLRKSQSTVDAYRYDVGKFLEYLHTKKVARMSSIKPEHIESYLGFCKEAGKSDATINRYYMSVRSYCKFLRKTGFVAFNLAEDIQAPKLVMKAPKILTKEQVQSILSQPDTTCEQGVRDRAILEVLYSSGLRASELCELELSDVQGSEVLVKCGKGSKTRTVPLTDSAVYWLSQFIAQYRGLEEGYLFNTVMYKQLNRQRLTEMVGKYAKKSGIHGVTTHTLRHACATHLLNGGANLRLIQTVLGHSKITSTERYTHLSTQEIQTGFQKYHPSNGGFHAASLVP